MSWSDRFSWSGETPINFDGLNPVALARFDSVNSTNGNTPDIVDSANSWQITPWETTGNVAAGPWGNRLALNTVNPAVEQGKVLLPFFNGLWPSAGKLLIGLWVKQTYSMTFNPLMSSRSGNPVAYLSTYTDGRPRQMVYDSVGNLIIDQYEDTPWLATTGWQWLGMLINFDARTSQLASVDADSKRSFLSPVRSMSGTPNTSSTAPLEVFALPHGNYWTAGETDEIIVAHPASGFNFQNYVERIRLGLWATGSNATSATHFDITDTGIDVISTSVLFTGAEQASWTTRPVPNRTNAVPYWSTNNGTTWATGSLPESFNGLLRWEVPLAAREFFDGMELLPPLPTLALIGNQRIGQTDTLTIQLTATWSGTPTWTVAATGLVATVSGTALTISSGWGSGDIPITVMLRDQWGRTVTRTFTATVESIAWEGGPPKNPRAPIIVWDSSGPNTAIIDTLTAIVIEELNGEHTLEFTLPIQHSKASVILPERRVELAGVRYRVRRISTGRSGRIPIMSVYCESEFYDLAYSGQVDGKIFQQVPAGTAIEEALAGTSWKIAAVNVSTRRTYTIEDTTPLDMLRTISSQHGGDLIFDTVNKTVSLVTQSGRDAGVAFVYGRGLVESKRVVDTTSLVTRIYARNADGITISSVNGGVSFVEDLSWTREIRSAVYDFAAGVSPFTMLSMSRATLANRSKPSYSYEFTVSDLSYESKQIADIFDVGDVVTVVDDELGLRASQRIIRVEHNIIQPWASKIVLSGKLRELGSQTDASEGVLSTGTSFGSFDIVPFNTLRNARFDNGLAHWASSGVSVVTGAGTGERAVRFTGAGTRWIEQTVMPDNRDVYSLSMDVQPVTGGSVPPLTAIVTVEYEDGERESIPVELS